MKNKVFSTMLLGAAVPVVTGEAVEFIPLGDLPGGESYSQAIDLSADGSTVLGQSIDNAGMQMFRWSAETGFSLVPLFDNGSGFPNFFATSISGDGSTLGGYAYTGAWTEAIKWSETDGFSPLGVLTSETGWDQYSLGLDLSSDGNAMAISGTAPITPFTAAIVWTTSMGLVPIGFLPEDQPDPFYASFSFSQAISSDGQTVVGSSASTKHLDRGDQAFRWSMGEGILALGFLPGENQSTATAVSADGSVVVGLSGMTAFRWTEETGMEAIGFFVPSGVSADGSIVVGTTQDYPAQAVIWTAAVGVRPLQTYLEDELNLALPGWLSLDEVVGISDDGTVIAGNGVNANGMTEAFLAKLESAVETSGTVNIGGAVSLFLVDPEGKRFGASPETGESFAEIPGLTFETAEDLRTAAWPDIVAGEHLVYVQGSEAGNYQLEFDFLHLDNQKSGASFEGELLKGGLHVYAADIASETAADSEFRLIYSDTDGDGLQDNEDAVPKSDLREFVYIGQIQTTIPNRVLTNGASLNDIIKAHLAGKVRQGDKVSAMAKLTSKWTNCGLIRKQDMTRLLEAVKQSCRK
jgi:uncharacterized membrane protein